MKSIKTALLACAASSASLVAAQEAAVPVQAIRAAEPASQISLPSNTEVMLSMNETVTTRGGKIEEGDTFRLSVVHDIKLGDYVVIPKGTPAIGEVTWKTGKGAFGKSGKMEVELRYIDLNGRRIPVSGKYRQEGEGNTVATVAGVIAVGVFAGFVTGKSATIPQGRELKAYTTEALAVSLPSGASLVPAPVPVSASVPATATSVAAPAASAAPTGGVTCVTC